MKRLLNTILAILIYANMTSVKAAEETTVQAFATWQSEGSLFRGNAAGQLL